MIRKIVLWMLVILLLVPWPLSLWIVPAFGGPQPNWMWKDETAIVLVEFDIAHAILLFPGELMYIYSRSANWSVVQPARTTVYGFKQRFDLWPLTLIGIIFGAYIGLLPHLRRSRRRAKNLCTQCAYDLRGSKERCPECNTPIDPAELGQDDLRSWRAKLLGAFTHYSSLVIPLLMIFVVLMAFVIGSCLP